MSNLVKTAVAIMIQARIPVLLWGSPGVGKTAWVGSVGDQLEAQTETVILSLREPADVGGLPILTDEGVKLEPPAYAKRLAAAKRGVLFFDELSTAPQSVQAACLRVIQEGVIGDLKLPKTVSMVAAANPADCAAGGFDLAAPLANRMAHFEFGLDPGEWASGMVGGWSNDAIAVLPSGWESGIGQARASIAAFIRRKPNLLLAMPKSESDRGRAWPSPRSWDQVAMAMAACKAAHIDDTLCIGALVGEQAAFEFCSYRKAMNLPDPEEVIDGSAEVPEAPDACFATLASVVAAIVNKPEQKRVDGAWKAILGCMDRGEDICAVHAADLLRIKDLKNKPFKFPAEAQKAFSKLLGLIK